MEHDEESDEKEKAPTDGYGIRGMDHHILLGTESSA
jgi:hypothetical protein